MGVTADASNFLPPPRSPSPERAPRRHLQRSRSMPHAQAGGQPGTRRGTHHGSPEFDNLILSHADRTRVIADEYRKAIASRNGMVPATFLLDGFVRGTWKTERPAERLRRS